MSPFSSIWARNQGGSTTRIPAEDLQLRTHASRDSDATATPTLDPRMSSTPTLSPPALHHSPRQLNDEALGEFFGGRRQRTRMVPRAPPPYSPDWDGEKLPGYAPSSDFEMETVARHMFKYGFCMLLTPSCGRGLTVLFDPLVFPLFWAIGVYFLFVPIRVSADWQSDKTEEEKEKILAEMKEAELKWAKRCLWALLSFFVCLVVLIVAVVLSRH